MDLERHRFVEFVRVGAKFSRSRLRRSRLLSLILIEGVRENTLHECIAFKGCNQCLMRCKNAHFNLYELAPNFLTHALEARVFLVSR